MSRHFPYSRVRVFINWRAWWIGWQTSDKAFYLCVIPPFAFEIRRGRTLRYPYGR